MATMLKDKMGTRFMIESITSLMKAFMLKIAEDDVVDIAHVNFTPAAMKAFMQILPDLKYKVIDSFNDERNKVLEEDFRRLEMKGTIVKEDMSSPSVKPRNPDELKEYVANLQRGHTYKIISHMTKGFDIPFVVYPQLVKPSVNVDLGQYAFHVFKYVSETLYSRNRRDVIKSTDKYLFLYPKEDGINYYIREIEIKEKDVNTEFDLYPVGKVTWTKIIDQVGDYFLIPSHFGTVPVMKDEILRDIYMDTYERCTNDMNMYAKSNWKTLYSVLQ